MALLCLAACGSDPLPPDESMYQWSGSIGFRRPQPEVLVLVVDDTANDDARGLRELVIGAVSGYEAHADNADGTCSLQLDPARWRPVDHRVIVVHPSATTEARLTTPLDDEALAWVSERRTAEEMQVWVAAVARALRGHEASAGARYRFLEAAEDIIVLLQGRRAWATAEERVLTEEVATGEVLVRFVLATAHDDDSPLSPTAYSVSLGRVDGWPDAPTFLFQTVLPVTAPTDSCRVTSFADLPPRLAAWAAESLFPSYAVSWPCERLDLLIAGAADGRPWCVNRRVRTDDAGVAQCRIQVRAEGPEPCPAQFGWLDPLDADGVRRPRTEAVTWPSDGVARICELRQLEGDALDACRTRVDCDGCEPGWCRSDVYDQLTHCSCGVGFGQFPALRFVMGADAVRTASGEVVCNLSVP